MEAWKNMASLSDDPQLARSLWLQLRSSRPKARRPPWRSDWMPVGILLLLMGILIIYSVLMPPDEAVERAKQGGNETVGQQSPVVGALAQP
jgi:hypothetical protein